MKWTVNCAWRWFLHTLASATVRFSFVEISVLCKNNAARNGHFPGAMSLVSVGWRWFIPRNLLGGSR